MKRIEKYEIFEVIVDTQYQGKEVVFEDCAIFTKENSKISVPAFKLHDEKYAVRFMPQETGLWNYRITLGGQIITGEFECAKQTGNNHGPVLTKGYHFRYIDGTRYLPFGTTCYAWIHQPIDLQIQTVETLRVSPFNKIRMCVFPKSMPYNNNDPDIYPFFRHPDGGWDVHQPDPAFWDNLDVRIRELAQIGVQADLILFHPYDRWGFATMSQEDSLTYLEYCIARLAAHSNIWWSLANEYEMLFDKTIGDWDEYGEMLKKRDPYGHLISIHNILTLYPKRDWMTHCSVQSGDINRIPVWKKEYELPVLIDECGYEGNIEYSWGNLSAFEMVHRFWWTVSRGGYCTHGETFHREDEILWWAKGGVLYGESSKRIAFLRQLLESLPQEWDILDQPFGSNPNLDPADAEAIKQHEAFQKVLASLPAYQRDALISFSPAMLLGDDYRLQYFGCNCPILTTVDLPQEGKYCVEVLDIWEMKRTLAADDISGRVKIGLPGKEGIAILITRREGSSLRIK